MHLNVEIKARSEDHDAIREILAEHGADFRGTDHQIDTYFRVPEGRLKLREGNLERNLIFYHRPDQAGPKASKVHLYPVQDGPALRAILTASLGVWKVVDKQREIIFVENVKFHLDRVKGLGTFMEIEAIDLDGSLGEGALLEQCQMWMEKLSISPEALLTNSYSDMIKAEAG